MRYVPVKAEIAGELRARAIKNFARLHDAPYLPGAVGLAPYCSEGWPGDWEGRTILALALLSRELGTQSAYLDEVVGWVKSLCNARGYRGEAIDWENINEQLYPSHSWLMRGLLEYAGDGMQTRDWIDRIVRGLFLPLTEHLDNYPQRNGDRAAHMTGGAQGAISNRFREWRLSSDIGCLFISLDGLSAVCERMHRPELLDLLESMAEIFISIDHVGEKGMPLQTHACLSGMRGVLRIYRLTGKAAYLEAVRRFFAVYMRYGMSEYFANFDWFKTPSWSEPCGVIDSYILALELWQATGEEEYLNQAALIWYNGVLAGQRPNGGFGCDSCAEDGWVRTTNFYEAFWCCTMRGAEGLCTPARFAMLRDGDALVMPVCLDALFTFEDGTRIRERTGLPRAGRVDFEILDGKGGSAEMRVFVSRWAANVRLRIDGADAPVAISGGFAVFRCPLQTGCAACLSWDFGFHLEPTAGYLHDGAELYTLRHGVLVLGAPKGTMAPLDEGLLRAQNGEYACGPIALKPLYDRYLKTDEALKSESYQILFRRRASER